MNAEEFLKQVRPAGRRSRLVPFMADIRKLRQHGCTLEQVCEFLAANQVHITVAGLSAYLRRQDEKVDVMPRVASPESRPMPLIKTDAELPRTENPVDLDRFAGRKVDLRALAKAAAANKKGYVK